MVAASMHRETMFVLIAAMLLTAIMSIGFYTTKSTNAQSNISSAGGNMTKGNMTNSTSSAAKNMTGPVIGAAGGSAGGAKNMTGK